MSTEAPTSPQARKSADDCIAEIGELAEFAVGIVADAERLCDRIAELLRRALLCDAQGRASTPLDATTAREPWRVTGGRA